MLVISGFATIWLLFQHEIGLALFVDLFLYGAMTFTRGSLTQAMVADSVRPDTLDTAFSLYFFIGFISGPFWTLVIGALIAAFVDLPWGYAPAFIMAGCSSCWGLFPRCC